jgi:hypothetical protein
LFNEVHRWIKRDWKKILVDGTDKRHAVVYYETLRDFFKAAARVWGEAWGSADYMVTKPVTLKAMVRVCADLAVTTPDLIEGRVDLWATKLSPWTEQIREFKNEGFYERFPAKGQVERVTKIQRELAKYADIPVRGRG